MSGVPASLGPSREERRLASPAHLLCFERPVGRSKSEREGFEPSVRSPVHRISSAAPSATRTPLQTLVADYRRLAYRR